MLKSYIVVAFRNLLKYKINAAVNITCLTLGLTCCILIMVWVLDELSFDRYHDNADRLYRVYTEMIEPSRTERFALSPMPLQPVIKEEIPEVEQASRVEILSTRIVNYQQRSFQEKGILLVDPDFLSMFSLTFLQGRAETVFSDRYAAVITETVSRKYFGEANPLGETVSIGQKIYTVTGVVKDIPHNSHLQFGFLLPVDSYRERFAELRDNWHVSSMYTYLLLGDNVNLDEVHQKLSQVFAVHHDSDTDEKLLLQPVSAIHLHHDVFDLLSGHGNITYVYIFSALALFVLFIAIVNFMNLATARSSRRAKEIGLRKLVGAVKRDLVLQFYIETLLIISLSFLLAIGLVEILLPVLSQWAEKPFLPDIWSNMTILLGLTGIVFLTAIISGSYPALFLAAYNPVKVLKGVFSSGSKSRYFRRVLVVSQFIISIVTIISAAVIYQQLNYIENKELGFNDDNLIYIPFRGDIADNYESLKNEIKNQSGIIGITRGGLPIGAASATDWWEWDGKDPAQDIIVHPMMIDFDYIELMGMEITAGRVFSREHPSDISEGFIVNEAAVKVMGMTDPVGSRLAVSGREGRIIGVVRDFHYGSLHHEIGPVVMFTSPLGHMNRHRYLCLKIAPKDISATLVHIEKEWKKISPETPFEYYFLDRQIDTFYKAERKMGTIFTFATFLTVLTSCLGLLGLASFTVEKRIKEIGIRKVLGASLAGIISLLSKELLVLVALANIFAWVLAYLVMHRWLMNFAYRTSIDWYLFVLSGLVTVLIAFLTISFQAIKAALSNPVEILKYE